MAQNNVINDEEFEDTRSQKELGKVQPAKDQIKKVQVSSEPEEVDKSAKYKKSIKIFVIVAIIGYILYLLGSSFMNYGKDNDILVEFVKSEAATGEVTRTKLYTSGLIQETKSTNTEKEDNVETQVADANGLLIRDNNAKKQTEIGLGKIMLMNLYSKTIYRLTINFSANSTDDYYHVYIYNSNGGIAKEYQGKGNFMNAPIQGLLQSGKAIH